MKKYYCYILSNKNRTVLYVGFTNNLKQRLSRHKSGNGSVFTKKYNVYDLIYYEEFNDNIKARKREKQIKNWHKEWKWNLIKKSNPLLKVIEI
ncbi:GIY-YIG nuclease family protein [Pseudofulvibacter geojedonensis]|uniref:GIY-YIG nuclease family protein n=1 Tax=Pseudofulvibacter geojedonensis TaxID=1123758 RepID=A0ABW3I2T8_9FLAO